MRAHGRYFLLTHGFAEDEVETLPDGSTAEVTISRFMKLRISNGDETQQVLSNAGDKGGTRADTFVDLRLKRSGCRKAESSKHITMYFIVNGGDEVP